MGTYALVKDGVVINSILWDGPGENGDNQIDFGVGIQAVEIQPGSGVGIGWLYDGTTFTDPNADLPSNSEILKSLLAGLSSAYQTDIETLNRAWLAAAVNDGLNENTKKNAVLAQIAARRNQYASERAAVIAQYQV